MALRDARHIRFADSLLGSIETSLSNGPIHFNCFSDFSICINDSTVIKALTLNIKTHGTLMVQGTSQIALIYRVYYKCSLYTAKQGNLPFGIRAKFGRSVVSYYLHYNLPPFNSSTIVLTYPPFGRHCRHSYPLYWFILAL